MKRILLVLIFFSNLAFSFTCTTHKKYQASSSDFQKSSYCSGGFKNRISLKYGDVVRVSSGIKIYDAEISCKEQPAYECVDATGKALPNTSNHKNDKGEDLIPNEDGTLVPIPTEPTAPDEKGKCPAGTKAGYINQKLNGGIPVHGSNKPYSPKDDTVHCVPINQLDDKFGDYEDTFKPLDEPYALLPNNVRKEIKHAHERGENSVTFPDGTKATANKDNNTIVVEHPDGSKDTYYPDNRVEHTPKPNDGGENGGGGSTGGGSTGGNDGGSTGGNDGGSTGGNDGGSTGGTGGGSNGGNDGGSTGGNDGGSTGGNDGGSTGGNDGGSTGGGSTGGGSNGGDNGGSTGGDNETPKEDDKPKEDGEDEPVAKSCNDKDMTLQEKLLCEMNEGVKKLNSEGKPSNSLNQLMKDLNIKGTNQVEVLDKINKNNFELNSKVDTTNTNLSNLNHETKETNKKLDSLNTSINSLNSTLGKIETNTQKIGSTGGNSTIPGNGGDGETGTGGNGDGNDIFSLWENVGATNTGFEGEADGFLDSLDGFIKIFRDFKDNIDSSVKQVNDLVSTAKENIQDPTNIFINQDIINCPTTYKIDFNSEFLDTKDITIDFCEFGSKIKPVTYFFTFVILIVGLIALSFRILGVLI
ncbi:hypothetical protein [Arcobacter porcinus]|uniref:Uncharacterized protein n=1 Tax=Arcobacter porcinus TaxID=1935204 RepID=A0ABX2YDF6_9BACT|nr:hypothetical protein [Arcobacter porcinus]OCL93029.1 hypothetical protein AAX28_00569 [Arcobacter porcinus]